MSKATIILIALVMGVFGGIFLGNQAPALTDIADVIGTLWLNGMRMTVVPLVVALLITGIVQTAEAARAGRLAGRAVVTMLAILWCSSIMAAVMLPLLFSLFPMPEGAGEALRAALTHTDKVPPVPPFGDFIRAMVPTNPVAAAANDALLPLLVFTAALGFAIACWRGCLRRLPMRWSSSSTGCWLWPL
jgi:proton glutamate symport protein